MDTLNESVEFIIGVIDVGVVGELVVRDDDRLTHRKARLSRRGSRAKAVPKLYLKPNVA